MLNGHLKNTTMLNSPHFSFSENSSVAEARWVVDYTSTQTNTHISLMESYMPVTAQTALGTVYQILTASK